MGLFLGIIQGLTEFLPVSSSGHLILFQHFLNLPSDMLFFNIILHLATLLAVVIVFRKTIWQLVRHPFNKLNLYLVISTAITCGLVVLFKEYIDKTFTYKILPITFLVTAIILFTTTFVTNNDKAHEVTGPAATVVGVAQFFAVTPGLSRSGTTISTLLFTGVKREKAADYSFLMSIPVIIASFLYELLDVGTAPAFDVWPTIAAFIAAVISGILAIKFMLRIIQNVKLHWFSLYLVILAIVCGILFYV